MSAPVRIAHDGVVLGNTYDKYGSKNPIVRQMMLGFMRTFDALVHPLYGREVLEVGCGEGFLTERLVARAARVRAFDIDETLVAEASARVGPEVEVFVDRLESLDVFRYRADVVVCCEVLEHLEDPVSAVDRLATLTREKLIVSVPHEPLWRALNLARGHYVPELGNTPGHLQHFSRRSFVDLLSSRMTVDVVRTPLPWIFAQCRPR